MINHLNHNLMSSYSLSSSLSSTNINRHGPLSSSSSSSFFKIFRLRLTLYFICILAITTTLYCLVSYKPDGLPSSSSFNSHPILLSSSKEILNEIIRNANRYYLDYVNFKTKTTISDTVINYNTTVPETNNLSYSMKKSINAHFNDDDDDELSKLIYMIDNLKKANCCQNGDDDNDDHFNQKKPYHLKMNDNNQYVSQSDNNIEFLEYDDFDDEDSNKVEYHLKHLGFDLKHIIYLYALSHPNNVSMKTFMDEKKEFQSSKMPSLESTIKSEHLQSSMLNLSVLLPKEFLNSIVFITAINSNQFKLGQRFIKSFEEFRETSLLQQQKYQHNSHHHHHSQNSNNDDSISNFVLMIYDLGLYPEQLSVIEKLCNNINETSGSNQKNRFCDLRKFQYDIYPSHISDLSMAAYRSIILQEMLRDIKLTIEYHRPKKSSKNNDNNNFNITLFWLDPQYSFIECKHRIVMQLQNETINHSGILSWPIEQPTSALTHPTMFELFHTTKENFYFHRMIRPGHLMISISQKTWEPFQWGIMLPWVRCALTSNCIAPLGSQWRSNCPLDKKPHYRYSGCHHYDMSVLNVVLGIAFNYSSTQYSAHLSRRFFTPINKLMLDENNNYASDADDNNDDDSFEYQFEDESKITGRFDVVLTDSDIPSDDQLMAMKSNNKNRFLFSFASSPSSPSSLSSI